ncbi:hypothetical protein PLESTB_001606600 [Pleodorina starrii]|uniref:Ribosomal protein L32 n=1 Tax=Pleodorina starrii TaxID=330485 RepID=A0A9W6BZ11_9CHLO|nr:hypothetical protein PLESTB_001606600 [Pleodorina starrii]
MLALSSSRSAAFSANVRVQPARQMAFPAPSRTALVVEAAVPKKKTSKSKTAIRKAAWKKEVLPYVEQALFKVNYNLISLYPLNCWTRLEAFEARPHAVAAQAKLALKEGSRDSSDKDMIVGGQAEAASADSSESQ